MKKYWWQEQPLTISAIQIGLNGESDKAFEKYVSKSGFNTEQLFHLLGKGDAAVAYFNEKTDGKLLDDYLKKAKENGIREIVYYNTHITDDEAAKGHPDWLQYNEKGEPIFAYGTFNQVCINPNGAWHRNFLKDLENLCKHDIDGIFFDGPVMNPFGCYCKKCQEDFQERFRHSIYQSTKKERRIQHVELVTQHIKEAYEKIKEINPEICVYLNNSALRADIIGVNPRKLYNYVDMLGAESGFHAALMGDGLWKVGAFAKHLACLNGNRASDEKPLINFVAGNQSGTTSYNHTSAETRLTYAQTLANGQNVWYGLHFNVFEALPLEATKAAQEMNDFILKRKDLFGSSGACSRIALMWSYNTANNYASSVEESDFTAAENTGYQDRGDHRAALLSAYDMLARNHIQFDIIDEYGIENGELEKYEALILPEVACLSDEVANKIEKFVEQGGNLLANFDVGMYNENGSFAKRSKLQKVLGLTGEPKMYKGRIGRAYMLKAKNHALLDGLTMFRIPTPLLSLYNEVAYDANVLMTTHAPTLSAFDYDEKPQYPALVEHKYGRGTAYYISGNCWETVLTRNNVDYAKIVRAFCDISSKPTVVSDEAGLYEVVLRRQENRFILHIVNLTGAMARPIEKIVPLHNIAFKVFLNGFGLDKDEYKLSSVRGAKLENVVQNGMEISFTLDKIEEYEIVVIE